MSCNIEDTESSTRMEPLARIEAWRLLARCHAARGKSKSKRASAQRKALEAAATEAAAVGYVFMEQLVKREMDELQ